MAKTVTFLSAGLTRLASDARGGVAVLYAMTLPLVLGFAALGVEATGWYMARQQLQNASDAAATAVATYKYNNSRASTTQLEDIAKAAVSRSGVDGATVALDTDLSDEPDMPAGAMRVSVTLTKSAALSDALTVLTGGESIGQVDVKADAVAAASLVLDNVCVAGMKQSGTSLKTSGTSWEVADGCNMHSNAGVDVNVYPKDVDDLTVSYSSTPCNIPAEAGGCSGTTMPYQFELDLIDATDYNTTAECTHVDLVENKSGGKSILGKTIDLTKQPNDRVVLCGDSNFNSGTTTFEGPGLVIVTGKPSTGFNFNVKGKIEINDGALVFVNISDFGKISGNGEIAIDALEDLSASSPWYPWEDIAVYADPDSATGDWDLTGTVTLAVDGLMVMEGVDLTSRGNVKTLTGSGCTRLIAGSVDLRGNTSFGSGECTSRTFNVGLGRVRPALYQ